MTRLEVDRPDTLIAFLVRELTDVKRSTVKSRLRHGAVYVNGVAETGANRDLVRGDVVELKREGGGVARPGGLRVLLLDEDFVVVHKPPGLLTVRSHRPGANERNVVKLAAIPLLGDGRLLPCHRLDRESSGALLLARNRATQAYFFGIWPEVEKEYSVVVQGNVADDEGTINAPLYENEVSKAIHVGRREGSKDAVTHFRVRKRGGGRTLLDVLLETGRRHQIRAHFAHLGHPVSGDTRYGGGKRDAPRMCLHSSRLVFEHPSTSKPVVVESRPPRLFSQLCNTND